MPVADPRTISPISMPVVFGRSSATFTRAKAWVGRGELTARICTTRSKKLGGRVPATT